MEQGSPEWFDVKRGKISASGISNVLAKGKKGELSKTREKYFEEIFIERITGITDKGYSNYNMENGTETEPLARDAYGMLTLTNVQEVGFVEVNEWLGCSPDGLVGDDGLIEIKSPLAKTHYHTIKKDSVPTQYIPQIQCQLYVTGRQWCDFVSFNQYWTPKPIYVKRVERDEEKIKQIAVEVEIFIDELKELESKVKGGM